MRGIGIQEFCERISGAQNLPRFRRDASGWLQAAFSTASLPGIPVSYTHLTLADYCVGTGPRLQLLTGDNELNNAVETEFEAWAHRVNLPAKLRTMRTAKLTDGEAFALLVGNPKLKGLIKLDVALIEADRVTLSLIHICQTGDGVGWPDGQTYCGVV